jgi:hypothetical protein
MKFKGIILLLLLAGCSEKLIEVSSVDQIPGTWRWESSCGGTDEYVCEYASKSNYATIEFGKNGTYVEKHMDTIFLQTTYTINKASDMFGSLVLNNPAESRPVTIINNSLIIQRGSFEDSYTKIK